MSSIPKTTQVELDVVVGKHKAIKSLASITAASVFGFVLAVTGYTLAMQQRVLYGVSLGGVQYGNQSLASLGRVVQSQVDGIEHQPLNIVNTNITTTLADLDIQLNATQAVKDMAMAGRDGSFVTQLQDSFSLLINPKPVSWTVTTSNETADKLKQVLSETIKQGNDASFALVNDAAAVTLDQATTDLDLPSTISHIRTSFLRGTPTVLYVQTITHSAAVTRDDLMPLLPQVSAMTNQSIAIVDGKKTATASRSDLIAWLQPHKKSDGQMIIGMNNEAITSWLDSIAPAMKTDALAEQVSSIDGSVLRKGREGIALDTLATSQTITTALQTADNAKPLTIKAVMTTVPAPTQTITPELSTTPGLYDGKYVEVDLSSQMIYQYEGTQLIHSYRVSSGKRSTPTPVGTYHINGKSPMAYSAAAGLYMPYWMPFIGSTYGLHALPVWPNGYKEGENHLGTPVSHGCVRLGTSQAAEVYNWIDIGTPVVIHR
jgi:lipoprotein-anchoring transpeptidase ErfK/SrfK